MHYLDFDPLTGESVTLDWNEADGTFTIGHHHPDMEPFLDANQRQIALGTDREQIKKGWWKYASGITNAIILKWRVEHGVDFFDPNHWPKVMQLLNSREYRRLKATELHHDR